MPWGNMGNNNNWAILFVADNSVTFIIGFIGLFNKSAE